MKKYLILLLLLIPSLAWGTVVADIDVLPATTVEVGEEVFFSASDTTYDGTAALLGLARYEWDFGDGYYFRHDPTISTITRSGPGVVHYFMSPGEKTVTMSTKIFAGFNSEGSPSAFASTYSYGTLLGMGTTKTAIANGEFKYVIGGTTYTLAANAVGTAPGNDVVPRNKYGAVAFDVGTNGTIDVIEAADNATGYSGWDAAVAGIPAVAADHVRIGTIAVAGITKAFTFGTTEFDDAGISKNIVPSSRQLVGTSIWSFDISGTIYTVPANLIGYSVGDDVIPAGRYGAVAFDVGTDLVVHTIEATDNATGYTSEALARAGLPAVAANHARMGTVNISKSDGAFTCGVTALNATNVRTVFLPVESTPIDSDTETVTITVTGTAPMDGFEIQRANFNNRTKQYLYVQVPATVTADATNKLKVVVIDTTADPDVETVLAPVSTTNYSTPYHTSLTSEEIYLLDHTVLTASHDYVLQAQLFNSSDEQLTGGIWRDKFTHWATTPTAVIDENNSIKVDGEFFFSMGPFMPNYPELVNWKNNAGSNTANTEGYYAVHSPTSFGSFLDSATTAGVYVSGPGRGDYNVDWSGYPANRWKFNHDPDLIEAYVTANKNHAALFSWHWQDEPNMGGRGQKVYPPVLAAWSYICHSNDPNHPATNLFIGQDWSIYYGSSPNQFDYLASADFFGGKKWTQDIFGFDIYPIKYRYHATINMSAHPDMGTYATYLDALDRAHTSNKNLVPVLMAINPGADDGYIPGTTHSEAQVYAEAWMNVIHGVKAICWFQYFTPSTIRWSAMKKFADQLNGALLLKNIVLAAPPTTTRVTDNSNPTNSHNADYNGNRVDIMERTSDDDLWIFAARVTEPDWITGIYYLGTEATTITTTFTVTDLLATDTVTVVDENRTISHGAGWFQDTFDKNAVHIYKITTDAPAADTTDPVVVDFSIPETYEALELPITTFQCSDAVGVTHYLINEVASEPAGNDASWATSAQTTYTFADRGAKTLYAWCKDAAGNISISKSDTTTLTTPNYDVSITIGTGCSVTPTTTQSIPAGETAQFTVIPEDGYSISSVTGCGGTWGTTPYETAAITGACTVTTSCLPTLGDVRVSTSAGTGCTITPSADQTIATGSSLIFTVGRSTGYDLVSVTGCGGTLLGSEYTTGSITEDCTVESTCGGHVAVLGAGGTMTLGTGGSGGGSSCSATVDKLGSTNTGGSPPNIAKDVTYCSLYTPSCYGSLQKAYVAHAGAIASSGKVCVYSDDGDSIANVGDLKIGCSGDISSGSTEWAYSDMDGGTLASGSYWVCFAVNADAANTFALDRNVTTAPFAYKTASGMYASPPDNLTGYTTVSGAGFSTYVTVGP